MNKTTLITQLFTLIGLFSYAQQNEISTSDLVPIFKERPIDYENFSISDSFRIRIPLKKPSFNKTTGILLPYPIIFIHGLNSNSNDCWDVTTNWMDSQFGTNYGGRFDFCLNYDGNYNFANTNFYPTTGADIAIFTPTLSAGDYFYINFDVALDGAVNTTSSYTYNFKSNQQAVVKQGKAIKWAINRVLQITGRDKVILMGHSMGGLAAREYLQNINNWQSDGKHHVAKLVTTGTPHGGSNASLSILNSLVNIDNQSEAVRDLRTSYYYSGSPGVYLFGGYETNSVMNDMLAYNFRNVDVNCNGITSEYVTGLNQKNRPVDLDYSCIIGTANILNGGDYVVDNEMADINNYYSNTTTNVFPVSVSHTSLPSQNKENMQGLDEPNEFIFSYHIGFDTTYTGFITVQAVGGYQFDYDDYKFSVLNNSTIHISINSILLSNLMARIVDNAGNTVGTVFQSNGSSNINFSQVVNSGNYYFEIYGIPTSTSYLHPYNFILTKTPIIAIVEQSEKPKNISIYPNPATSTININGLSDRTKIKLYDVFGKLVLTSEIESDTTIDISELSQGIYTLIAENINGRIFNKIIITK